MTRSNPKRTSRTNTPRPRKIAGAPTPHPHVEETPAAETAASEVRVVKQAPKTAPKTEPKPAPKKAPKPVAEPVVPAAEKGPGLLASARVTRVLIVVLAVLTVLLVLQFVWLVRHQTVDAPEPPKEAASDGVVVPSGRPVVPTTLSVQEGVQAAADAAQKIVARTWENYDTEVDEAAALMTSRFEPTFRETVADVKPQFIERKIIQEGRVVAQGVVRANETELEALVFLNLYVVKGEGEDARTEYTPYRALLTMVHTDQGWLVDGLDTK